VDRRPAQAAHRFARTLHRAVWIGCSISILLTPASVWAQAKSNKNVRTWSWADEVVQPGSNVISRQVRTNGAMREITRQLLREARRAAERGQFDSAEKLALRAEALLKAATAAGQDAWDSADQTPSSFLRQLAAARLRQMPLMPRKEPVPAADELAETELEAPPPPVLNDPLDPPAESTPQRGHQGRSRPHDGHTFANQTALDWSANPTIATPSLREQSGAFDAAEVADDFDDWDSPPAAQVARTNQAAEGGSGSPKARPAKPAADQVAAAASPAAPAPTVVTERIIQVRDENEPPQRSLFASALAQILSTATGLVLGILVLVAARAASCSAWSTWRREKTGRISPSPTSRACSRVNPFRCRRPAPAATARPRFSTSCPRASSRTTFRRTRKSCDSGKRPRPR